MTDSQGAATDFWSDSSGDIISISHPNYAFDTFLWDDMGNQTLSGRMTLDDSTLWSTKYSFYDEHGNETESYTLIEPCTQPCENMPIAVRTKTYDESDNLISMTDELGRVTTFVYDSNGNLLRANFPGDAHVDYTYDSQGRVLTMSDAAGNTTDFQYDAQGNLASATDPEGNTVAYAYDALGRKTSKTDARGMTTAYQYDALGRVVKVIDALAGQTDSVHRYAGLGSLKDQNNNTTTFQYNTLSQLTGVTDATGHGSSSAYDLNGNLATRTDYNGSMTTYTYDTMNRPTAALYPDSSQVTYTYDPAGRLVQTSDSTGNSSYLYDARGKLKSYTNGYGQTLSYTYDEAGNLITLTYPGGKTLAYAYDALNRLVLVTDWAGRETAYIYDPRGLPTRIDLPNGTAVEYDYDDAGRLISLSNLKETQNIISYTYLLDPNGSIVEETSDPAFTPDLQPLVSNFSYGADNRLITVDGAPVTYDLNGNMLVKGGITYQYDYENRLKSVVGPEGTWEYAYDAKGNRTSIKHNGTERRFLVNPNGATSLLAEYDANNNLLSYYVYGKGLLYKIDADGNPNYYHYNSTGHTVAVTDADGAVVSRYSYAPFGGLLTRVESSPNLFRYAGKYGVVDDGNGLLFMRARYYEPGIGRFITKDPLGFLGGINTYAMAANNPVNFMDPMGLCSQSAQAPALYDIEARRQIVLDYFHEIAKQGYLQAVLISIPETVFEYGIGTALAGQELGEAYGTPGAYLERTLATANAFLQVYSTYSGLKSVEAAVKAIPLAKTAADTIDITQSIMQTIPSLQSAGSDLGF